MRAPRPAFRQKMFVEHLECLLNAPNDIRWTNSDSMEAARQICGGVDLAVKIGDRVQ